MIKISKEYLFLSSRVGPIIGILIHLFIINILIRMELWIPCLVYSIVVLSYVFIAGSWRSFLLKDAYIDFKTRKLVFKNLKEIEEVFNLDQVVGISNYWGISKVIISHGSIRIKRYFISNDQEYLNNIKDGISRNIDTNYYSKSFSENQMINLFKNNKWMLIFPIISMSILAFTGYLILKHQNNKLLNYEFHGKVDSISYDPYRSDKVFTNPTVFIQGKRYSLALSKWGLGNYIQPGDSLIKLKNKMVIILIKKSGKKITFYNR